MRLAIVGLGLIGGSIARALAARDAGVWHVTAWSRNPEGPRTALADAVVDVVARTPEEAAEEADLVLLAAPPLANLALVAGLGPAVAASDAVLTDVTSAQAVIAGVAAGIPGLRHVGGHPMAGTEARGYDAARADLFVDRPWILVPSASADPEDVDRVRRLAVACGAVPLELRPDEHDRLVAAISHLPLIVAAALAETVTSSPSWQPASRLAAGGWRDSTRVARGDPELGAGIAALGRSELLPWIDRFAATLESWRADVAALPDDPARSDAGRLRSRFDSVRAALLDESGR